MLLVGRVALVLTEDTCKNRVLKTCAGPLVRSGEVPEQHRRELGHTFHCRTLDLGQEFSEIATQLDKIAGLIA